MNPNNLTIKTQEVISNAQMIAMRNQNQQIETLHILKSMLEVDDNVIPFLLKKQEEKRKKKIKSGKTNPINKDIIIFKRD